MMATLNFCTQAIILHTHSLHTKIPCRIASCMKYCIHSYVYSYIKFSGGQTCLNNPNVKQRGQVTINDETQVIVPDARFNCNGRLTNVAVSMKHWLSENYPMFQVWRPSFQSDNYNKIGEVQLSDGNLKVVDKGSYIYADISLNSSSQIEFQSKDVIGYYQPSNSRLIWNTKISGSHTQYTSYSNNVTSPLTTMDISHVDNVYDNYQPLIEVMFGKILQYCYTAKCMHD